MATGVTKHKTTKTHEPVTNERIAMRAYELYLQRGAVDGYDVQDWLTAEQELKHAPAKRTRKTVTAMTTKPDAVAKKTVKATRAKTPQRKTRKDT